MKRTKRFRVRVARLIEQEADFWIDVHENMGDDDVLDYAADIVEEVADGVWRTGDMKPDKIDVVSVVPVEKE